MCVLPYKNRKLLEMLLKLMKLFVIMGRRRWKTTLRSCPPNARWAFGKYDKRRKKIVHNKVQTKYPRASYVAITEMSNQNAQMN